MKCSQGSVNVCTVNTRAETNQMALMWCFGVLESDEHRLALTLIRSGLKREVGLQ